MRPGTHSNLVSIQCIPLAGFLLFSFGLILCMNSLNIYVLVFYYKTFYLQLSVGDQILNCRGTQFPCYMDVHTSVQYDSCSIKSLMFRIKQVELIKLFYKLYVTCEAVVAIRKISKLCVQRYI